MKKHIYVMMVLIIISVLMIIQAYAATTVTLYTLDGSSVSAETDRIEQDPWYSQALEAGIAQFTSAIMLGGATRLYNCHSYAWYSNYSNYWINDPTPFILDDHTSSRSSPQPGDKVIYYDSYGSLAHSGIVVALNPVIVVSKWGQGPLVEHHLFDVPSEYLNNGSLDVAYYSYPWDHSYVYTYSDEMYHQVTCTKCDYLDWGAHDFSSSGCIHCGYNP